MSLTTIRTSLAAAFLLMVGGVFALPAVAEETLDAAEKKAAIEAADHITAFDAAGNELGTAYGDNDLETIDFFGLTTRTPIARVTVTFTHNIEGYGADDLSFGEAIGGGGCEADFNGDQQVDFFDYLDFVAAFDAEDPSADFNGDNQVDFFDYLDFAAAFDGCQ